MKTIIADLHNRIAQSCHRPDPESEEPLLIGHISDYDEELQEELTKSMALHQLQSRRVTHLSRRASDAKATTTTAKGIQHDPAQDDPAQDDPADITEDEEDKGDEGDDGDKGIPETFDLDPDPDLDRTQ